MEISQIRYFCALVETAHMRRAAELLGMSPGALSKSMSLLQGTTKSKLFVPDGRGIEITETGKRFYQRAQRLIAEYESLQTSLNSKETESHQIRIASFELFTTYFMAAMISTDFSTEEFVVLERAPGAIEASILSREADIGITYAPVPHKDIEFLKIGSFEKRIFAVKGAFKHLPISEIPFTSPITQVSGSPTGITSLDGWPSDIPRKVRYHFELLETALQAARLGLCAVFCPEFVIPLQNQLAKSDFQLESRPLPSGMDPVRRNIFIAKRRSDPEAIVIKKIAKNLRQVCSR